MTTKKIKVNISFEIDSEDLEDLRSSIYALSSDASYYDLDSSDGKEYYPKWVHEMVEELNWNTYKDENGHTQKVCEVCIEDGEYR